MKADMVRRVRMRAWQSVLPDTAATALLSSCLQSPPHAARSWQGFCRLVGNPVRYFKNDRYGLNALLPFVAESLERNKVDAEAEFMTYARVALVREELRSRIYYDVLLEVSQVFATHHLTCCVLRGAAVGTRFYPTPYVRHNHALDLLVHSQDLEKITNTLDTLHYVSSDRRHYTHASGLPVVLHTSPLHIPYDANAGPLGREDIVIENQTVQSLRPTELLYATIANAAFSPRRRNFRWLADTYFLLEEGRIDWSVLARYAQTTQLGPFFALVFTYVNKHFSTGVPKHVIGTLQEHIHSSDQVLFASLLACHGRHGHVWQALIPSYLLCIKFLLFSLSPPLAYIFWQQNSTRLSQVVWWHVTRPFRVLSRLVSPQRNVF